MLAKLNVVLVFIKKAFPRLLFCETFDNKQDNSEWRSESDDSQRDKRWRVGRTVTRLANSHKWHMIDVAILHFMITTSVSMFLFWWQSKHGRCHVMTQVKTPVYSGAGLSISIRDRGWKAVTCDGGGGSSDTRQTGGWATSPGGKSKFRKKS